MNARYALISLLCVPFAGVAYGQSTSHSTGAAAHRTTATKRSGAGAAAAVHPADNPPGVPPVHATPKALYSLRYVDMTVGTGELAPPGKWYTVKYTGWLTDGTKFDSSYDHPGAEPITFFDGAKRVITGWDTGFTGMRVGGKRRLYIPYQLAYGENGREGAIPPRADLIFDIELVGVSDTQTPQTPPAPASAPTQPGGEAAPDAPKANPN